MWFALGGDASLVVGVVTVRVVIQGVVEQEGRDEGGGEGLQKRQKTGARLCSTCRKPGHNARTCPEAVNIDSVLDPNLILSN